MTTLYLASQSPRRKALLHQIGVSFVPLTVSVDETPQPGEVPEVYVERMARLKARAGLCQELGGGRFAVLGADTAVVLGDEILGKPADRVHGLAMLRRLAGREHRVLSSVCLADGNHEQCQVVTTRIRFRPIGEEELARYWASGEPVDKAGGYAIQGLGAVFVEALEGSYSGVVGLPLFETARLLRAFHVPHGLSDG